MGMAAVVSLSLLLLLLSSSTAAPKGEAEDLQGEAAISQEGDVAPRGSIQGPGYSCSPAFPDRQEVEGQGVGGQGLLLCNKTSSGPGFHWTEVARLAQTEVIQLQGGECETLGPAGFRCVEHYQCLGSDHTVVTSGAATTRILSVQTTVSVQQMVPGSNHSYSFSVLDATDTACSTYTQVCCGPKVQEKVKVELEECEREEDEEYEDNIYTAEAVTLRSPGPRWTRSTLEEVAKCQAVVTDKMVNDCIADIVDLRTNTEVSCSLEVEAAEETRSQRDAEYRPGCGQHHPGGFLQRVVNMEEGKGESQFGEWPHMCAVLGPDGGYRCGASLLSPSTLLTAAHCNVTLGWTVRCGDWDSVSLLEPRPHADREVSRTTAHPDYNPANLHSDLALVEVARPFELAPHIDTVCLPRQGQDFRGQVCTATGWGKDRFGSLGSLQEILKEVEVPIVDQKECQKVLRGTRLGRFFELDPSFMCAGGEQGVDTCTGDGGSPLVCQDPERGLVQAGVVSWGLGCGEEGLPGVYSHLAVNTCWLVRGVRGVEGQAALPEFTEC